jgi:hypothetical protein
VPLVWARRARERPLCAWNLCEQWDRRGTGRAPVVTAWNTQAPLVRRKGRVLATEQSRAADRRALETRSQSA